MLPFSSSVLSKTLSPRVRFSLVAVAVALLLAAPRLGAQESEAKSVAPTRLVSPIDEHALVTLHGNVRRDLAAAEDLGAVEDEKPLHLYLLLQRTTAQQADLDNLIARQQEPTAAEYHKWLTPKQFGARFGASPEDVATVSTWLQSHGFQVRSVLNNASTIDFAATAGQVREAFHTELHYFNIEGGKYAANIEDPQIPAALTPVVAGIVGLVRIPPHAAHTTPRQVAYDAATHRWRQVNPTAAEMPSPGYTVSAADGEYDVTPQDLYKIYNINPVLNGGNLAATATVSVIEQTDMEYGTVNATTGVATGGDLVTFRNKFGVAGTLNLHVYHGYGSVTCTDPGIVNAGDVTEASLDAEWINATAPSANEIYMSCDADPDLGILSSIEALVDNNLSDVMSMSYSNSELNLTGSDALYNFMDSVEEQAATQGQSIFVCAGDSGSDDKDQDTTGTATSGINVSGYSSNLVTVVGGTDFSDFYDANEGGPAESTYWSATNTADLESALGYIPETTWNGSCASSIGAVFVGEASPQANCAAEGSGNAGSVVGGGGGISTHFATPAWQTGISGYSNAHRASPDVSGFASNGVWGHSLVYCDSQSTSGCFAAAGGTSFVAPYLAGVTGLLVTSTGSRQGLLNPALYALAKAQYAAAATKTACYSNGQTANTGVTTGLPAAACIFNDVTTSNNDVPCAAGSTGCYVSSGAGYGLLSLNGATSLDVAYPSAAGFDESTGLGTINVSNLITKWNTAFGSTTALSASPTSLTSSQSTSLTATVSAKTPTGYVDTPPALTGTASFKAGTSALGTCTLSAGTCKLTVSGSALQSGANSVTATFSGSKTYPASTSSIVTVTVTGGSSETPAAITSPAPSSKLTGPSATFVWTSASGATSYILWLGTTGAGSNNLWSSGSTTATSVTFGALPTNGATIYARLWTAFGSTTLHTDYTYTAESQAVMTSPASGSTFAGPSVTFKWSAAGGATSYSLWLGTTGVGSNNLWGSGATTATSITFGEMPTNGEKVYVRLWTALSGTTLHADYTYTTATQALMTSPTAGSTFAGASATFKWTAGTGATSYAVWLGSTGVGSNNLGSSGGTTATSYTKNNLPTNGEKIYVRLWTTLGGNSVHADYTYTAATEAVLTSPTPGSTFTSSSVTFKWTAAAGATSYTVWLGSTGVGSNNLGSSGGTTATSYTRTGLPTNGEKIYVRLYTSFSGGSVYADYTYTAQ